jgi:hypothetical protein
MFEDYNSGMTSNEHIDPQIHCGSVGGFGLPIGDQNKIISFLKPLTDQEFAIDPRFQRR